MRQQRKQIGLAVVGCGTIGRIRAEFARDYPGIGWLGLCDSNAEVGQKLVEDAKADFFTTDYNELLNRPEVTAAIIATDENAHVGPLLAACERRLDLFIEKPLATDARDSARVLKAIEEAGIDAVMGYTNRFRRRFQAVKGKLSRGEIGEVTSVVTRAFMNRMVPIATIRKTNQRQNLTPMVVSGTHALDMSMYLMEGKTPVSVYARSVDKALAMWGTKDSTFRIFTMHDGTLWSMNISWALPTPGVAGSGVRPAGRHRRHRRRHRHRGHPSRSGDGDRKADRRRLYFAQLQARVRAPRRFPHQLSGGRHERRPALGPDAGRDQLLVRAHPHRPEDAACVGRRGAPRPAPDMAMDLSAKRGTEIKLPLDLDEFYK